MPKVLCLHGYGTSAAILQHQLGPFIAAADPNYEFVFLEGDVECQRAQGIYRIQVAEWRGITHLRCWQFGPRALPMVQRQLCPCRDPGFLRPHR
jgi:predicted esterase